MSKRMMALWILLLASSLQAVAQPPADASAAQVMAHHIAVVKKDDVAAVLSDYAADAVLVTPGGTLIGSRDIRGFFEHLAAEHRDWSAYHVTQEVKPEGVVLQREAKSGRTEVFVVRHGKIVFQVLPG